MLLGTIWLVTISVDWAVAASSDITSNTKDSPEDNCTVVELNGYLHQQCGWSEDDHFGSRSPVYKCPNSDLEYSLDSPGETDCQFLSLSERCPSDPGSYQACGHSGCAGYREVAGKPLLCGTYFCYGAWAGKWTETNALCYSAYNCEGDINMADCKEDDYGYICDGNCDRHWCADEADCNGFQYGLMCERSDGGAWSPPKNICDGYVDCVNGEDESADCFNVTSVAEHEKCEHAGISNAFVRIQPNMRCWLQEKVCTNGQDQTNCTDPEKVAMQCLSQGYPTTVSIYGYCKDFQLCDDDYNNECIDFSGCKIHKGQFCDGHVDCDSGIDENCKSELTDTYCVRRFQSQHTQNNLPLPLPLSWAMDDHEDCLDGMDEDENIW